jgi:hypothetical protein
MPVRISSGNGCSNIASRRNTGCNMATTHCIEDFQLDITFGSEVQAHREQACLGQWLSDDLLPALDVLFSRYAPGKKCLRFERLEFDLGKLHGYDYQQQIKQQLLEKLAALLRERRLALPAASAVLLAAPHADNSPRALEQLILFLRTGQIPWYNHDDVYDTAAGGEPDAAVDASQSQQEKESRQTNQARGAAELDKEITSNAITGKAIAGKYHQHLLTALLSNPSLADTLRKVPERELILQRLVSQFPDEQLSRLLKYTAADFYPALMPSWQLLGKLRDMRVTGGLSLKQLWWKNVLRLWLDRAHESPAATGEAVGWPAKLLQALARDLNLPAAIFYQQLLTASQQVPVDSKSEFVRYLRGVQSGDLTEKNMSVLRQPPPPVSLTHTRAQVQTHMQARKKPARELRYQLAQIFNGAEGETLALLWPELLMHHRSLLRAALTHYLAIPTIRQKLLLQFPVELLGDMFAFAAPECALPETDKSLAETYKSLAHQNDLAENTSATAIERDLWEISFNIWIQTPDIDRHNFLQQVIGEWIYRTGVAPAMMASNISRSFGAAEAEQLIQALESEFAVSLPADAGAVGQAQRKPAQVVEPRKNTLAAAEKAQGARKIHHQIIDQLEKNLGRVLVESESEALQNLLARVLNNVPVAATPKVSLALALQAAAALSDNLLNRVLAQLERRPINTFASSLTNTDWQLLVSAGLRHPDLPQSALAQEAEIRVNVVNQLPADKHIALNEPALVKVNSSAHLNREQSPEHYSPAIPSDSPIAEFTGALHEQADPVAVGQNLDLRWQEFLRQLQRGNIVLGDLHLNDSNGIQIIAHYLNQASHIKPEYRQNLLASIGSMSSRASDTADYFRRLIYCLIYQQPLDFDEILTSRNFWQQREKPLGKSHRESEVIVAEAIEAGTFEKPQAAKAQLHLDSQHANKNELAKTSVAEDYDQQLWALLMQIKKSTQTPFYFSLPQLQQLVEFYLIHSPELADQYRRELAAAIARRANQLQEQAGQAGTQALGFNYYANLLQRLLASAEIDVTDPQLLLSATWVQMIESINASALDNPNYNDAQGEALSGQPYLAKQTLASGLTATSEQPVVSEQPSISKQLFDLKQLSGSEQLSGLEQLSGIEQLSDSDELSGSEQLSIPEQLSGPSDKQLISEQRSALGHAPQAGQLSESENLPSVRFVESWTAAQEAAALWANSGANSRVSSLGEAAEPLTQDQLKQLHRDLRTGALQLDDLPFTERQWHALAEFFIADNLSASVEQKKQILQQLTDGSISAGEAGDVLRRWLRQQLQSVAPESLAEYVVTQPELFATQTTARPSARAQMPNRAGRDAAGEPLVEVRRLMESTHLDEDQRKRLRELLESRAPGSLHIDQMQASLSQLMDLTEIYLARVAPPYRVQMQETIAALQDNKAELYRYYVRLLQALASAPDAQALAALVNPAKRASQADELSQADEPRQRRDFTAIQVGKTDYGEISPKQLGHQWQLADLLAAAEKGTHFPAEQSCEAKVLQLGELIAQGRIHIHQLQASLQQLAGLVEFFIARHAQTLSAYRDQLLAEVRKHAELAGDKRRYFAAVLHALLQGHPLDLEFFSNRDLRCAAAVKNAARPATDMVDSASPSHGTASPIHRTASSIHGTVSPSHGAESQENKAMQDASTDSAASARNKYETVTATNQTASVATIQSDGTEAMQTAGGEQSLLELLFETSLTQAQSIRLQELLQAVLNRGKADAIRLWFNSSLDETQLLRLIELLPDYALHQLLRLAQPQAYTVVLPQAKHVLDALAATAPGISAARLHKTKWLFILQQCLANTTTKPDHKMLFHFAQQLAGAAAISDTALLEKLLRERLALQSGDATSASEKQRTRTEELLQEALQEGIHISNAGQVLAAPYMGRLFAMLQLTDQGEFVSLAAKDRAVLLLEYMVTGSSAAPEYDLLLNKVLCGMSTGIPVSAAITITEQEETIIGQLLNSVIQNWKAIGSTSVAGLRETFLRRQGWLRLDEDGWHLQVQAGPFDMLLDQLPWSISLIKHGWMEQPLRVSWRQ